MKLASSTHAALGLLLAACNPDYNGIGFHDFFGAPLEYDDSDADLRLEVAAVALEVSTDPAENLAEMSVMLEQIEQEHPDTRLVVFGETSLGWYYMPDDPQGYQESVAQPIPGEATETLGAIAAQHDVHIAFGMVEERDGELRNVQVLLDTAGEVMAVHIKTDLTDWGLESGFVPGDETTVVEIDGVRAGMFVCSDVESQWAVEDMADQGIELLVHSWASAACFGSDIDPSARMMNTWVVTANRYGDEDGALYLGTIYVSDPAGTHRVHADGAQQYVHYDIGVLR